jgi:hypothetical protein
MEQRMAIRSQCGELIGKGAAGLTLTGAGMSALAAIVLEILM